MTAKELLKDIHEGDLVKFNMDIGHKVVVEQGIIAFPLTDEPDDIVWLTSPELDTDVCGEEFEDLPIKATEVLESVDTFTEQDWKNFQEDTVDWNER